MKYKIWLDDLRQKPQDTTEYTWLWYKTAEELIEDLLKKYFNWHPHSMEIVEISLDNDLGEGLMEGYQVLDWLESLMIPVDFNIHIHTSNPVARERMRATIKRNGWMEVR